MVCKCARVAAVGPQLACSRNRAADTVDIFCVPAATGTTRGAEVNLPGSGLLTVNTANPPTGGVTFKLTTLNWVGETQVALISLPSSARIAAGAKPVPTTENVWAPVFKVAG